ncbi:MAG: methyl-accepting chemotaxis protein [Pseudomonadota bacterium]
MSLDAPSDAPQLRRDAIDNVATLRARAVRVALFARLVLSPPEGASTGDVDTYMDVLRGQVNEMVEVLAILQGRRDGHMEDWIAGIAADCPDQLHIVAEVVHLSEAVRVDLEGRRSRVEELLAAHFKLGRGGFFEAVTGICNALWADVDAERRDAVARSAEDMALISQTLGRMERIGKHVRLVALNASVEAARAGDAGKGLAVIAHEFKGLAEEIQSLAATARRRNAAVTERSE